MAPSLAEPRLLGRGGIERAWLREAKWHRGTGGDVRSCVHGYNVYKDVWATSFGKMFYNRYEAGVSNCGGTVLRIVLGCTRFPCVCTHAYL